MSVPDKALERFLAQFHVDHDVDTEAAFSNTQNRAIVPEGERKCPICDVPMNTEIRDGVKIDVCSAHGVWLDYGELEIICERIDRGRDLVVKAKIRAAYDKGFAAGRRSTGSE
jgi:Zn-finger nucleic acid-binding protein